MQSTFDNSSFRELVKRNKAAHKQCKVEKIKNIIDLTAAAIRSK